MCCPNGQQLTKEEYQSVRRVLLEKCNDVSPAQIKSLKLQYEDKINSTRRCEYITTVVDLVAVLEKRDELCENNITILKEIEDFLKLRCVNIDQNVVTTQTSTDDVKDRIHKMIIESIGTSWLSLARELNIKENKLDSLKRTYRTDTESCASEVLKIHKVECHPMFWKSKLLKALSLARREDLRMRVEEICDLFN